MPTARIQYTVTRDPFIAESANDFAHDHTNTDLPDTEWWGTPELGYWTHNVLFARRWDSIEEAAPHMGPDGEVIELTFIDYARHSELVSYGSVLSRWEA